MWHRRASAGARGAARATVRDQGGCKTMGAVPGDAVPPRYNARAGLCQCQGGTVPCRSGTCDRYPEPSESWGRIIAPMPWQRKPKPPRRASQTIQGKVEPPLALPQTSAEFLRAQGEK